VYLSITDNIPVKFELLYSEDALLRLSLEFLLPKVG
jgi:hypothetical protein